MKTSKILCGLIFLLGLKIFILGQQDNQSQECLKKANEFKNSVFILLDPGHGGPSNNGRTCYSGDPGAQATHNEVEYHEACMTTDLSLILRDKLKALGLDVDLTREVNKAQGIDKKAELIIRKITSKKKDKKEHFIPYFISIHFNSGKNSNVNGNYGIYAHSQNNSETVAEIVTNAQNTPYLSSNNNPITINFPQITLKDNQNSLFKTLQTCIRYVLVGDPYSNTILYDPNGNDTCPARESYKSLGIYRMGIFPLLSKWYAGDYTSCDQIIPQYDENGNPLPSITIPNHFSGTYHKILLPNDESIPVKHSLQEVEFINNTNFLNYLNLRPYVAMAMASAVADDIINDFIKKMKDSDACIKAALHLIDYPDDNQSSYSGSNDGLSHSKIDSPYLLPFNMVNQDIIGLFNKIGVNPAITFNDFSMSMVNEHPVLIIPSGFLAQIENDSTFKINLEQYVKNGGTVIVFGQQYGSHIDNVVPLPEGQSLHSYGWREDQSCYNGSVYFKAMHPALSGLSSERLSAGVDGYFSSYPDNATVLLRRISNQEPCLLYYPYGNGTVILTSMYTDWGMAHSQASTAELRVVRDLITFSRNPKLSIPEFDLTENSTPTVALNVKVKNSTELNAVMTKIKVLTPNRSRVLYEIEQNITLNVSNEGEVHIEFDLSGIASTDYGICHSDYELYDAAGNLIQPFSESDGGRFAVHMVQNKYNPGQGVLRWLTVHHEELYLNQDVELDVHFRNTSDQPQTIDIPDPFLNIGHGGDGPTLHLDTPINLEIPAGEERIFHASMPMSRMGSRPPAKNGSIPITMRMQYVEEGVLRQIGAAKVVFLKAQATSSSLAIQGTTNSFKNGTAIGYSIAANNNDGTADGVTKIKLMVDRFVNNSYQELETIYESEHDFTSGNAFQTTGQFIPSQLYAPGTYRMRLAVSTSDNSVETKIQQFYYVKSNIVLALAIIPEAYEITTTYSHRYGLVPGLIYSVNFNLRNLSAFPISQGRYTVTLKSEGGTEVFRKEVTNLAFSASQELAFSEPFVFAPIAETRYNLKVEYSDESRTASLATIAEQQYQYLLDLQGGSDQIGYRYLDIANFQLKVAAVGAIHIKLSDITTGAVQERDIVIPTEQATAIETFQIPIGYPASNEYEIDYEIRDSAGIIKRRVTHLLCLFPKFKYASQTDSVDLKQGTPLNLQLDFSEISGVKIPFNAVLSVKSASLNYDDTQTVTIQPGINNEFNYQIPVTETAAEGSHTIEYQLLVEGRQLVKNNIIVTLPTITLKFVEPPANISDGTPFDLKFQNSGGKPGTFTVFVRLFDEFKKQVLEQQSVLALAAGEQKDMIITLPEGTKSGRYILLQEGRHESSGQVFKLSSNVVVSGMTATLNAYTLKGKYFDNETVAGKAEIGVSREVVNGKLRVKILRNKFVARSVYEAGDFSLYRRAIVSGGGARANKTYLLSKNKLFSWDYITNKYVKLIPGEDFNSLFISTSGEFWLTTSNNGVWHLSSSGSLIHHLTIADGLLNNNVSNFSERDKDGRQEIWMATSSGISVFSNGALSSYTTADGLSSNNVFDFARDGAGEIWVWSDGGIDRFNGSRFDNLDLPFDPTSAFDFGGDISGSIWMTTGGKIWRYALGEWNNWDMEELFPGTLVYQFAEDDGQMWFLGTKTNSDKILLKYDGSFTLFSRQNLLAIGNITCIIPCPDRDGVLFGANPGFVEFSSGKWQLRQLEIDMDKLLSPVTCITGDSRDRVWIGSSEGVSCLDKGVLSHYLLGVVSALTAGTNGVVYAAVDSLNKIKKIEDSGISDIGYPIWWGDRYRLNPAMGFDTNGRLWYSAGLEESTYDRLLFCYDGVSSWIRAFYSEGKKIVSDGAGSIWVGFAYYTYLVPEIFHINNDFSVTTRYQGVYLRPKDYQYYFKSFRDFFLDSTGVLWIIRNGYDPTVEALQTLQNDIFTLKAVHSPGMITPGYPLGVTANYGYGYGLWGIAEKAPGEMVFAGRDENNVSHLYKLNQDGFAIENDTAFYPSKYQFISVGESIYTIGYLEADFPAANLLKFGGEMSEDVVWSGEFSVNTAANIDIDLLTGKTLAAGNYILSAELISAIDQQLAKSDYGFLVKGSAVAASISKSGAADPNVRAGSDQGITFEVLNNTAENKPELSFKVKKVSPSGVETILQEGPLSLTAGQSHNGTLIFNESETGVWQLNIEVRESGTLLDSAELIVRVSEPAVAYEIIHPEYAGDESFPVKIKLANTGQIPVNVHVSVGAIRESPLPDSIDEDVALNPVEERILSFNDTITANCVYDIVFSGDLETNEQKTVKYGYVENLVLNVLPQYQEGSIVMGYTVANGGGLPFSDTLHFGLYAAGNAIAIYAIDKTYNLYPGAEPLADALELLLAPGAYQLRWTTGKGGVGQADFVVLPSGIGQLAFAPAAKYPIGLTEMAYQITNNDTVAGNIPLLIEIVPAAGGAAVYTENRNYYINAGESISDNFSFDFAGIGSYIARISGAKVVGGTVSVPFKVLNLDDVTTSVAVQPASDGAIPVQVNIANTGYNGFAGTLVIEAGGLRHEEPLTVISEATLNQPYNFDANGLSSSSQEVKAYLYDAAGNTLSQNTQTVMIRNADIKMVEVPQNLAIATGNFANVTLKVKNEGNRRGEAKIAFTAFDTLNETRELALEAGEEIELNDIYIDVDADIPAGRYPFNYTLSGLGVSNGLAKGNFTFQVNGIALEVTAALDRSLYNEGETAQLTLNIASANPVTTPLEVVVNWNDFSERRSFVLDSGSSSQVFEIPLTEASEAKVFYGIYQEEGRGIYLNDIYLNFTGNVSVTLDQQVYAPGDSIHALFAVGEAGSLTAECFGQSQTIAIGSSGSIDFAVPTDALGGSYGVSWTFTPSDVAHESASGSKAFDVSGLVVKVAKAELESGKYAPGDSIKAMLTLESNRDISLSLRSWTTTPEGQWTYLGEQGVTLSAAQQTPAVLEYAFNTTEAGTHRFVYGLYREEQLVVSGAAAFDCGDAVLLGLATDHLDYPDGNETVKVKVDYFGAGTANLKLFLDDLQVDERTVTLAGLGSMTIDLTAAQISGGRHDLRAIISKDDLTSTKGTWFGYGSNLPDLAVGMSERSITDLNYTYTIRVSNNGKTSAPASTLVFSDNNVDKQTATIGALTPAAWQEVQFTWSGSGHAGSHALAFTVDRENAIKEYVEANNVYEMVEEVPALFYKLSIDPQLWPANANVSIFSRFINNTESNLALQLHLTLTHNASSLNVLTRDKTISLSPYTTTLETDIFNTGTYPVGDYTLSQTANSAAGALTEELAVIIEASKVISGTMTVTPTTVAAGSESQVSLQLMLRNGGNVALENEPLTIKVTSNESQETVKSEALTVTLALGESKTIVHDLALNLAAGAYTVSLEYLDNVVAQAELTAANGLDKDKYVSRRARALFMNLLALPYNTEKNYLKSVFNAGSIIYQDTSNIIESYLHFQKGENNINIVFGSLLAPYLQKELKERVSRGEGLIYIADSILADTYMKELSGVKVRSLPLAQREKNITLLPGLLGSGGSAVLLANCKLMLEMVATDVQVIGETKNGKKPLLAYHKYGRGKVLTICMPLNFTLGGDVFSRMLLNAVNLFSQEVFSRSDLARVMPMELRIKNNTSADKVFRVQEMIPQTATAYGFNPQPLAGEGIKWDVNLKVNEEKVIGYWLQLTDAIGTFDIESEIYDGQQKIDEALLTFEVVQKVVDRVVELITEINASGDTQAKKALAPLNRIKNLIGDDALTLLLNLDDSIQAAGLVGKSTMEAAALWRQQLQNVMMAYARKLYDKIKNFGPFELSAFGSRFQE